MDAAHPARGVAYPLKLCKSVRRRGARGGRGVFALKFKHIPDKADMRKSGSVRRDGEKIEVVLACGGRGLGFSGVRTGGSVGEYVVVFYDGKFWLERVGDVFCNVKSDGRGGRQVPDVEPGIGEGGGDEWRGGAGSPITPEYEGGCVGAGAVAGKAPMASGAKRVMVTAGRVSRPERHEFAARSAPASKSVAGKGVAGKSTRRRGDGKAEESSSGEEESSSDESDSESGDSSGQDSDAFTDKSTDED